MSTIAEVVPATGSRLTVLSREGLFVQCRCTCGVIKRLRVDGVRSGAVRSCGCLSRETRRRKQSSKLSEEQITELVEAYRLGYKIADIAKCLNTTYGLVYCLLKHRGEIRLGNPTILGTARKLRGELSNLPDEEYRNHKNTKERAYYAKWKKENREAWRASRDRLAKRKRDDYAKNKAENSDTYRTWLNTRAIELRDQKYGLVPGQWDQMLIAQSGRCGICCKPMQRPHVDHDHTSGKIRELLCSNCNTGLGGFRDSVGILVEAKAYLARHGR